MRRYIYRLLFITLLAPFAPVFAAEYGLLLHTSVQDIPRLPLTDDDARFIADKRQLVMGIFPYDAPPFGMRNIRQEYEGLSADYVGIIARQLNLPVRIIPYASPEEAWRALAHGQIDFIPSVSALDDNSPFILSLPYASDKPMLGVNVNPRRPLPEDLANADVAMVRDYLPLSRVQAVYPKANFRLYDNYQEALSAVAFEQADAYLGNSYSLSRNYLNNIHLERFSRLPSRDVSLAFNRQHTRLLALVNRAMQAVPEEKRQALYRLWQPDLMGSMAYGDTLATLSEKERLWIARHPSVKVLIYSGDKAAPVSFVDNNGILRGMVADLLAIVSLRTGLHFTFTTGDTVGELLREVNTPQAEMFSSMTPSEQRIQQTLFTRPYLRSAFVLTTTKDRHDIHALADLRGKRLALIRNSGIENMVRQRYPEIDILSVGNVSQALSSVAKGDADAAVGILIMTNYQINTYFHDKLKVVSVVGDAPAWISFGVGHTEPELHSILDKVLLSIPPSELENLANRWRPNDLMVVDGFWYRYRDVLIASGIFGALFILLSLGWALYLRKQIARKAVLRRQLNDQLAQLREVIDSMPFPVSIRDGEGRLSYCNQSYLVETGVAYEQTLGRTMEEAPGLRSKEQASHYHQQILHAIAADKTIFEDKRYELYGHPGSSMGITVYQWFQPYHDSEGLVAGVICGWMDITEREALFAELREAKQRAEDSNRAKSVFLSTMSHEIRTPMNAIIGMLDIVLKKARNGEHDLEALEVAYESAESLVGLIGDILDISRIEGGQIEFHPESIHLGKLIDNMLKVYQGLAIDKNLTLTRHFPDETLPDVYADPLRIKQVLSNLLSNAIKFTDYGQVDITLQQTIDEAHDRVHYCISVQDSGIGIDAQQQAALFKPFSQAENRRAGTGLGLYISRTICENMQGDLTLLSEKGKGTTVCATFWLPKINQAPAAETLSPRVDEKLAVLNVLVVDDNAANRILLAKQLAWLGQHAHLAESGDEALKILQDTRFDVIITDCNMPGMNGYQLTQAIRERERQRGEWSAWIVGFTANAMHEVTKRCLQAGMNDCLFKPCSINSLAAALQKMTTTSDGK